MTPLDQDPRFVVLLPVKPAAVAKSRLLGLGDGVRRELVAAFAMDTATAALGSEPVAALVAVTLDLGLAEPLVALGAHHVRDGAEGDLNASLRLAAAQAHRRWPDLAVAALCADLPALRSSELSVVLTGAPGQHASFVVDADGAGTTMLAAPGPELFTPRFGPQSRKAHRDSGAAEVDFDVPGLRRDVDTPTDLRTALALGVGPWTAAATAGLRL